MISSIMPICALFAAQERLGSGYWTRDIHDIQPSMTFPITSQSKKIHIPIHNLIKRAEGFQRDARLEPVYVSLPPPYSLSTQEFASSYASGAQNIAHLHHYLITQPAGLFHTKKSSASKKNYLRVILNPEALQMMDLNKFTRKFSSLSHQLSLSTTSSSQIKQVSQHLLWQAKPFFHQKHLNKIKHLLNTKQTIHVHKHLLPDFAKKMYNTFVPYRGPNCFHAAVAFQEKRFLTMKRTNLRKEPKHHELMINHDELWHLLNWYFYEINPKNNPLRYGDMLVFFEIPDQLNASPNAEFRWIVHASTYLFNNYVFSKGSKSPNTPYTIKRIEDEWETWTKVTKGKLALKVFRRSFHNLKDKSHITNRTSWLF
ncbi:MAG: hypothetical protein OXC44_00100 [Proteobacteria bacterium]|nr:hypothetical protein [Pseudomonadota bacterium]